MQLVSLLRSIWVSPPWSVRLQVIFTKHAAISCKKRKIKNSCSWSIDPLYLHSNLKVLRINRQKQWFRENEEKRNEVQCVKLATQNRPRQVEPLNTKTINYTLAFQCSRIGRKDPPPLVPGQRSCPHRRYISTSHVSSLWR